MAGYIMMHFFAGAFIGILGTLITLAWAATRSKKKYRSERDKDSTD